jgi:hypothetical protein
MVLQVYTASWVLHNLRVFLARRTRGGENPCIDTKDVLKLLIVSHSAVRLLVTLGARSAW